MTVLNDPLGLSGAQPHLGAGHWFMRHITPRCFSNFHTNGLAWWVTAVHSTIVPFLLFCQKQKHWRGERRETSCLVIQPVRRKGSPVVVVMKKISALTEDRT